MVAGAAAGIAAAFNTPLGGIVFAIEELSRRLMERSSALMLVAIVVAGLVAVSAFGNLSYFGRVRTEGVSWWDLMWPGFLVALSAGLLWMGVDLASASVPAAPAWVTPVDALATDSGRSHEH